MAAFACAGVFWHYRQMFGGWSNVLMGLAVLMGFSRLYLYVHFPTDVLCGALLGLLASWTGVRLTESLCALKLK